MDISELRRLTAAGNVQAQVLLGVCHLDGLGVDVDPVEALRLLSGPAQQGVPRAAYHLATMFARGLGVPRDATAALRLYQVAGMGGEFFAQIALGRMNARGEGVPADAAAATRWYAAAIAHPAPPHGTGPELAEARAFVAARF